MRKPPYELVPLRAAVNQCRINITAFQKGISDEENRIDELQGYIHQWEEYNRGQNGDTDKPNSQPEDNNSSSV